MARGSSSGGSPRRKTSKTNKANRNNQTLNVPTNAPLSSNMSTTAHSPGTQAVSPNPPTTATTTPSYLAPPAPQKPSRFAKNPISLVLEMLLISLMLLVTMYFNALKAILPRSKKVVKGKVVLITGTGRGLGRALAIEFAKLGALVACVDVDQTSNEETARLIVAEVPGAVTKAYTVNVAASAEISALAVKVELDLGPIDILINNAAVIIGHSILGATDHTIAAIININLLGHFWMVRTFLPSMMKRNSGHIVAISSITSLSGVPKLSAYTASKWGVNGMMDSLREELREHPQNKIKTTVVVPHLINTSADYMKYMNSRMPVLSVDYAAKMAINGILAEEVEFSIPSRTCFTSAFTKMLPVNISDSIKNIFYVKVILPPQESQDNLPNMKIINRTTAVN